MEKARERKELRFSWLQTDIKKRHCCNKHNVSGMAASNTAAAGSMKRDYPVWLAWRKGKV